MSMVGESCSIVSLNVRKRGPCEATRIARSLRRLGLGSAIVCLQEIPKWTAGRILTGTSYVVHTKQAELARVDGFDCGFLVPSSLNLKVKGEKYGKYWGGLVLAQGPFGYVLVVSAHFIQKCQVEGDAMAIDLAKST